LVLYIEDILLAGNYPASHIRNLRISITPLFSPG
jgi:hypothetical protein